MRSQLHQTARAPSAGVLNVAVQRGVKVKDTDPARQQHSKRRTPNFFDDSVLST
jgi:hypothetical protein